MSGISPSDECLQKYNVVKTKGGWGVFEIQDEKTVECTHSALKAGCDTADFKDEGWGQIEEYCAENLMARAAYIVSEFRYTTEDGRDANKLVLISWCPENKLKVKAKMLHGSTLNSIKQTFEGLQGKPIQASGMSDLEFDSILGETK